MKLLDFDDQITQSKIQRIGMDDEAFYTQYQDTVTRITFKCVETNEWSVLEPILLGANPQSLYHMSRVVGYFSRIENWNKSKIGELHDRHKGTYEIGGNND